MHGTYEDLLCSEKCLAEYRSLDLSTHIFAITSPPGGVHIFAWLPAFATLRPNLAYFRLLPPYAHDTRARGAQVAVP